MLRSYIKKNDGKIDKKIIKKTNKYFDEYIFDQNTTLVCYKDKLSIKLLTGKVYVVLSEFKNKNTFTLFDHNKNKLSGWYTINPLNNKIDNVIVTGISKNFIMTDLSIVTNNLITTGIMVNNIMIGY